MHSPLTLPILLRRLLPLSASDMAMALGDPLVAIALARMTGPEITLAALGIIKALANFLESPIIMLLHASTALSASRRSRQALWRFTLLAGSALTALFLVLTLPPVYRFVMGQLFSASPAVSQAGWAAMLVLGLWPGVIAWRRYFQGILIREGRGRFLGLASLARIGCLSALLIVLGRAWPDGALVAASAIMGGLLAEAALVTWWARQGSGELPDAGPESLPTTLRTVGRYYFPLATTMVIVWGGRAVLVSILARAVDGELALAAWAGGWGFVILLANSTRMVQQLVITHARQAPPGLLVRLALTAGAVATVLLVLLGFSTPGRELMALLLGGGELVEPALLMVRISCCLPLLVALQNTVQGYCIVSGQNRRIQWASLAGTLVTLGVAAGIVFSGGSGLVAGAASVPVGVLVEILWLSPGRGRG
ncbi:MAG: hypothetical protein AMXMBFR33_23190 [Candidatus Xenobia bacterium]